MSGDESEFEGAAVARLGTVLKGKYKLERILGIGGMAVVYAGTHRNQKQFAVKMLHGPLSMREDMRQRFLREGYAANSLKHPGAVAVLDDDVADDGAAFIVMELLEGVGLEELWDRSGRRLGPGPALVIADQALDVLAAAHAASIVHRDIKPSNLFLTRDLSVKVLDFGIARVRDLAAAGQKTTGSGLLLGTPAFMAPEQALGDSKEIDGQTDLWAIGATLFTLLSGHLVHEGDNSQMLLVRAATTQARSVATVADGLAPAVAEVVDRALAFTKDKRWPSAVAMQDAVHAAYATVFGHPIAEAPLPDYFPVELVGASTGARRRVVVSAPRLPGDSASGGHVSPSAHTLPFSTPEPAQGSGRRIPAAAGSGSMPGVGISMAEARRSSPPATSGGPRSRRNVTTLALAAGGLALAAGLGVAVLGAAPTPKSTAAGGTPAESATSQSVAAPAPSSAPSPSVAAAGAAAEPQDGQKTIPKESSPTEGGAQPRVQVGAAEPPHPRPALADPGKPAPSGAGSKAPAKPDCTTPTFVDSSGHKAYKPECL